MRTLSKGKQTIVEFFTRVRTITDTLMSIGDPVLHRDQIELVLEALPSKFDLVVAVVNSRSELFTLDELE